MDRPVAGAPLEIERKYRLARVPSEAELRAHGALRYQLLQVYLVEPPPGQRVRRVVGPDGAVSYWHTRKRHLRALVREEDEREIDEAEYLRLLAQADPARRPIRKTRLVAPHGGQELEIDVFDEPAGLVLVEVELRSEDEAVEVPGWLGEARDVSDDPAYANASLARRDAVLPAY